MQENRTTSYAGIELVEPKFKDYQRPGGALLAIIIFCYVGAALFIGEAVMSLVRYIQFCGEVKDLLILDIYNVLKTEFLIIMLGNIVLSLIWCIVLLRFAGKLRERDDRFLRYFQLTSIVALGISLIMTVFFVIISSDFIGVFIPLLIGSCVIWAAILLISLLYFPRSERVCVYMGSDAYLRDSLFNGSAPSPLKPYEEALEKAIAARDEEYAKRFLADDDDPTKWICPCCAAENKAEDKTCSACNEPKPLGAIKNRWRCKQCGRINLGTIDVCSCGDSQKNGTLLRDEK